MCLYPRIMRNRRYTKTKKNGGNIPPITDQRKAWVPIGCQECIECKKQKARSWQARLTEDIKTNTNGKFITLTFSNESIEKITKGILKNATTNTTIQPEGYDLDNAIARYATRHFLERWRKKYKTSLRHWLVTELGHNGTENIHIHGILWTDESYDELEKHWQYGYIWPRKNLNNKGKWIRKNTYVNEKTINYITKYVNKVDQVHKTYKSIILTSSGIGNNYTRIEKGDWTSNKFNGTRTKETYRTRQGTLIALPIYYRNKIYTEDEREKLWTYKLDKQERWVLGNKISIKNGEEEYNKALKQAQKLNWRLGYGNGVKDWTQQQYEKEKRNLKIKERIERSAGVCPRRTAGFGFN